MLTLLPVQIKVNGKHGVVRKNIKVYLIMKK